MDVFDAMLPDLVTVLCTYTYCRAALEDLLNEYEVDLVLSGHVHSYSRTCNVLDWRCADEEREGGMTHVTVRQTPS